MGALTRLETGTVFARDYRVVRPLAEGGMGAVYLAEQVSTGKRRALKVMLPSLVASDRNRERFAQEARVGSRIASSHVVEVVGAGVDEETGAPWLAMELLEGEDFSVLLQRRGALPFMEVLTLLGQVCHALEAAHAAGIVHCDLKPENLFVARPPQAGVAFVVKVLDFGIARLLQEGRQQATVTTAIGSPLWMAPEQAQTGGRVSPATDVWAVGLIAFTLLTGRFYWLAASVPPAEFNLMAQLIEIASGALEPASTRARSVGGAPLPPSFDAWFARCVARSPEERFADVAAAFRELQIVFIGPPGGSPVPGLVAPTGAAGATRLATSPPAPAAGSAVLTAPTVLATPTELAVPVLTALTARETLPAACQRLRVQSLSDEVRARLRAVGVRARREGRLIAGDNLGGELAPAVIGVALLVINGWVTVSQHRYDLMLGTIPVAALPIGLSWWLVRRRMQRGVGTFLQPTGAYFVSADGVDVVLYSWASLRSVRLIEQRLNGVYIGTNVELDFGGTPLAIAASDLAGAHSMRRRYEAHGEEARAAVERGAWSSLEGADLLL